MGDERDCLFLGFKLRLGTTSADVVNISYDRGFCTDDQWEFNNYTNIAHQDSYYPFPRLALDVLNTPGICLFAKERDRVSHLDIVIGGTQCL